MSIAGKTMIGIWILMLGLSLSATPTSPEVVPLWPLMDNEATRVLAMERIPAAETVIPDLYHYAPDPKHARSQAVIVCPGGGYHTLSIDVEGRQIAEWLCKQGFHAFVLKYRLPQTIKPGEKKYLLALQDVQRSLRIIRSHSKEWGVTEVGLVGFSAGGHLAATAAAQWQDTYPACDAADHLSARPDFICLVYPAYLMQWSETVHAEILSPELMPNQASPPTLLIETRDDNYPLRYCDAYVKSLTQAKVPVEVHLYDQGGHGYGMTLAGKLPVGDWPNLFVTWSESCQPPYKDKASQTALAKSVIDNSHKITSHATTSRR